jgi:hypothetical protein
MKILSAIDHADIVPIFWEKTRQKLNVLISYAYLKGSGVKLTRTYRKKIDSLYLDSGAFSASMGKVHISLSEYRRFIRRFGNRFDEVFTLDDKFDDPHHNMNNQHYLEEDLPSGSKRPIPVLHDKKDPMKEFTGYVDQGHDYIAVGSNMPRKVLDKIWKDFSQIKIHMFGKLNRKLLFDYRPYSADASTWAKAVGFGKIYYWDPEDNKEYTIDLGEREGTNKNIIPYDKFHHKNQLDSFLHEKFEYNRTQMMSDYTAKRIVNLYFFNNLGAIIDKQSK